MDCKLCGQAIIQTFASIFSRRELHVSCEQNLLEGEHLIAYPFLEGVLYIDYVVDRFFIKNNLAYFEQFYMGPSVSRMIESEMSILYLESGIDQEDLYLLFLLSGERLYWVFFERPSFLE